MNRKMMMVIAMATIGGAMVSAHGWMGAGPGLAQSDAEELTVTGRLRLVEDQAPVIVSDGTEYVMRVHPAIAGEISVRNGQEVTVEGLAVTAPSPDLLGEDHFIHVSAMEADGTRVVIPEGSASGLMRMHSGLRGIDRVPDGDDRGIESRFGGRAGSTGGSMGEGPISDPRGRW